VAHKPIIFELNDTALERIIFAMEDQSRSHYIDLRTGDLVPRPAQAPSEEAGSESFLPEWIAPPPEWSPADGFRLMETFCGRISRMEPKLALIKALSRGRGVFKTFRQILAEYPKEDSLFREYKNAVLRHRIELWMDDMRQALGLARLGVEPEEFQDLVDEEFIIETSLLSEAPFSLEDFIVQALDDALKWMPSADLALEKVELLDFLRMHRQQGHLHYINEAEGNTIAAAAMATVETEAGPIGLIRFLYVVPEFRDLGLELKLIESLCKQSHGAGSRSCFLRCALIPSNLASSLESNGFRISGAQYRVDR